MLNSSLSLRCETIETSEPAVALETPPAIEPARPQTPLRDRPRAAHEDSLRPSSHVLWIGPAAKALSFAH
jgi:hypothetical protein